MFDDDQHEQRDEEYVDIISELNPRFPQIIAQIFKYLTNRELCIISFVSRSWREACLHSYTANIRRTKYLKKRKKLRKSVGQENWPIKKRTPVATNTRREAFSDINNVYRTRLSTRLSTHSTNTTTARNADIGLRAMR